MSPLKLYEYLAAGLPVASVDLPPIRAVGSERVVLCRKGGDFADAVAEALALGREDEEARREFIAANSWAKRHDELLDFALS